MTAKGVDRSDDWLHLELAPPRLDRPLPQRFPRRLADPQPRVRPHIYVRAERRDNPRLARARSQSMKSRRAESEYVWTTESRCAVRYRLNRMMVLAQGVEP